MIINENIHPLVQKALYRKVDALNRFRLGTDKNFFAKDENGVSGDLEPMNSENPIEQHLFRACFAKVSAAIIKNKEGQDIVSSQPVSLASYYDIGNKRDNQFTHPLTFRRGVRAFQDDYFAAFSTGGQTGITSISVEQLSFFTKKFTINFACPDPIDFEDRFQPIFLRHGQYIAIEFGWGTDDTANTIPDLSVTEMQDLIDGIRDRNLLSAGNYVCDVGEVTNYTYKLESYGGYTGTIDVVTRGQNILNQTTQESSDRSGEAPIQDLIRNLESQANTESTGSEDLEAKEKAKREIEEFQINSTTFNSVVRNLDKVIDDYLGPRFKKEGRRITNADNFKEDEIPKYTYLYNVEVIDGQRKEIGDKRFEGVTPGRIQHQFKNGALYLNLRSLLGGTKTPANLKGNYFMSWGWFEDHILNSFFSIETKGGRVIQEIRSAAAISLPMFENTEGLDTFTTEEAEEPITKQGVEKVEKPNKCRASKFLVSNGLDGVILPGRWQETLESDIDPEFKDVFTRNDRIDLCRNRYIFKEVFDKHFNAFTKDNQEGIIRNMVFPISMYQKHFAEMSTVRQGMQSFWADVTNQYGGFWNFVIMQDDNISGRIGVVDFLKPSEEEKKDFSVLANQSQREDFIGGKFSVEDKTDKIFTFNIFQENTIVKSFDLSVKLTSKAATLVNYANNTNITNSIGNASDAKDLGLLAYSLLFKTKIDIAPEDSGDNSQPEKSQVTDFLFPLQRGERGRGVGTNVSTYKNDEEIRKLETRNGIRFVDIAEIQEDQQEIIQKMQRRKAALGGVGLYDRDGNLSSWYRQRLNYIINYSTAEGDDSNIQRTKPIIPVEVSMTIDGTGGIRPGDLFRVDYLPKAYRDFSYFFVSDVGHSITTSGWETTIKGLMKVDTKKMFDEGFIQKSDKPATDFRKQTYETYVKELADMDGVQLEDETETSEFDLSTNVGQILNERQKNKQRYDNGEIGLIKYLIIDSQLAKSTTSAVIFDATGVNPGELTAAKYSDEAAKSFGYDNE